MPHLSSPGTLILRTRLRGPRDQISLTVNTGGPLGLDEVTFEGEPGKVSDNRTSATLSGTIEDQPATIELVLRTGENSDKPATLTVTYHAGSDPTERPLRLEQLVLPWAPAPPPMPSTASVTPPQLAGGDATRGAAVFASDEAKCATCHMFRGHGKAVGPDLSNLHERDVASIFRDIAEPSATINPDYVPYTVAVKDGRVLSGIVKAEGADAIRVTDTNAQSTVVKRAEIEELRPTNTSIMPVGLAGAIGEQKLRDLVSYLTSPPEPKK
jgi:putative heme-binding domain-containing protein